MKKQFSNISPKKLLKPVRSPLFYVGDKYKIIQQLRECFPDNINTYYDVFCGGGSASMNIRANRFMLNDINTKIIELHLYLQKSSENIDMLINKMHQLIKEYGLSLSEEEMNDDIKELKKYNKKTYFSKYNKVGYEKLKKNYNTNGNTELLYLLLIYGFNHMIRFNKKGQFNLPVGNVDWNKNVTCSLINYAHWYINNKVMAPQNLDFEDFVQSQKFETNDFLYFDPPYLITASDYNKYWNEKDEQRLYNLLDGLDHKGILWGLSNMIKHKGEKNNILIEWSKKYYVKAIRSNYISRFDNTIKKDSEEIYVTNFRR